MRREEIGPTNRPPRDDRWVNTDRPARVIEGPHEDPGDPVRTVGRRRQPGLQSSPGSAAAPKACAIERDRVRDVAVLGAFDGAAVRCEGLPSHLQERTGPPHPEQTRILGGCGHRLDPVVPRRHHDSGIREHTVSWRRHRRGRRSHAAPPRAPRSSAPPSRHAGSRARTRVKVRTSASVRTASRRRLPRRGLLVSRATMRPPGARPRRGPTA